MWGAYAVPFSEFDRAEFSASAKVLDDFSRVFVVDELTMSAVIDEVNAAYDTSEFASRSHLVALFVDVANACMHVRDLAVMDSKERDAFGEDDDD